MANTSLSISEIVTFRTLKKTAIVLMLMLRLDRPTGETEIAETLELHIATARSYLKDLAQLGYITRTHHHNGYILTQGGRQLVLPASLEELPAGETDETARISRFESPSSSSLNTLINNNDLEEEEQETAIISRFENPNYQANLDACRRYGLGQNNRVKAVCNREGMEPEYIDALAARLKGERKFSPGMLLTCLDAGDDTTPAASTPKQEDTFEYRNSEEGRQRYADSWGPFVSWTE